MSGFGHIALARCWGCQLGDHYEEVTPHGWMDDEDAEYAGLEWPLTKEQEAAHLCNCTCGGGPGAHVPLTAEASAEIAAAIPKDQA